MSIICCSSSIWTCFGFEHDDTGKRVHRTPYKKRMRSGKDHWERSRRQNPTWETHGDCAGKRPHKKNQGCQKVMAKGLVKTGQLRDGRRWKQSRQGLGELRIYGKSFSLFRKSSRVWTFWPPSASFLTIDVRAVSQWVLTVSWNFTMNKDAG